MQPCSAARFLAASRASLDPAVLSTPFTVPAQQWQWREHTQAAPLEPVSQFSLKQVYVQPVEEGSRFQDKHPPTPDRN